MKIIDIYKKIAKGEEVPIFKIKGRNFGYKYFVYNGYLYEQENDNEPEVVDWQIYQSWLNYEIEIIEEVKDKEYEDIGELCYNTKEFENDVVKLEYCNKTMQIGRVIVDLSTKIDALIRNQKYILERLDKND